MDDFWVKDGWIYFTWYSNNYEDDESTQTTYLSRVSVNGGEETIILKSDYSYIEVKPGLDWIYYDVYKSETVKHYRMKYDGSQKQPVDYDWYN